MKTKATNKIPEIDWELGDRYDSAGDGHVFYHHVIGASEDGVKWVGSGIVCDGNFDDVEDIEKAPMTNNDPTPTTLSEELQSEMEKLFPEEPNDLYGHFEAARTGFKACLESPIAKRIHREPILEELQRRLVVIKSEPNGIVRETMIDNLLNDISK